MKVLQRHLLLGGCSVIAYLLMHIRRRKIGTLYNDSLLRLVLLLKKDWQLMKMQKLMNCCYKQTMKSFRLQNFLILFAKLLLVTMVKRIQCALNFDRYDIVEGNHSLWDGVARIFFQSLDTAIFLFSRVSEISCDSLVLLVILTNDRLTVGCELQVSKLA